MRFVLGVGMARPLAGLGREVAIPSAVLLSSARAGASILGGEPKLKDRRPTPPPLSPMGGGGPGLEAKVGVGASGDMSGLASRISPEASPQGRLAARTMPWTYPLIALRPPATNR